MSEKPDLTSSVRLLAWVILATSVATVMVSGCQMAVLIGRGL